ncbi:MAG TPA: RNA polymerase sigma factor [Candidatus Dormibacteraeota bacterium]
MQNVADSTSPSAVHELDERAFAELLRPLIEPGFRLALAMLHDSQAAEDAVQEASFTAWRKLGRIRDRDRIRPWFLGVVANKCRNARRGKWIAGVSLGLSEDLTVASSEERAVRGADLRHAVSRLRYDDRLVVVLYFYLDMPLDDVAAVVGSSVGAARARLYRAVQRLRPDLEIQEAIK